MQSPTQIFIRDSEEAKSQYKSYREAYAAFWASDEGRTTSVPFNSPFKESTFIKRIASGKAIKVGNTWFIPAPSYKQVTS